MKNKTSLRVIALLLVLSTCLSSFAFAVEYSSKASSYISSYSASVSATGRGGISIYFDIVGTGAMDSIGATTIELYQKIGSAWYLAQTFSYTSSAYASTMMGYKTGMKYGKITYSGVAGREYYAHVYLTAAKGGGSDSRLKITSSVTAT